MNNNISSTKETINEKAPIMVFSTLALLFSITRVVYSLRFQGLSVRYLSELTVFYFLPTLLLFLCPLVLYRANAKKAVLAVIYGLLITEILYNAIYNAIFGMWISMIMVFFALPTLVFEIIALVNILRGKPIKAIFIIVLILNILYISLSGIFYRMFLLGYYYYYFSLSYFFSDVFIYNILQFFSVLFFQIALLILSTKNAGTSIPKQVPANQQKTSTTPSHEQALLLLVDKFELGLISEEEYRVQRAKLFEHRQ